MHRHTKKGMRLTALSAIAAMALAACGSSGGGSSSGSSGNSGSGSSGGSVSSDDSGASGITLRMTVWTSNKDQLALFDQIGQEYVKNHPDVAEVKFDVIPVDGYTTSLTTQLAGGDAPDLGWILERTAPSFISSGAVVDIAPTVSKTDGYDYGDLSPAALKLWKRGDKLYAYPFSTSPFALFYNKDLFDKAGAKTPDKMIADGSYTWSNVEKAAAKITAANPGKFGFYVNQFDYKIWSELAEVWRGFGAAAWSSDGKTCQFSKQPMVDAMTFLHKAIFKDKAMPPPGTTVDFLAGDAGMTTTQISKVRALADSSFDWGMAPLPAGPKGSAQVIGQAGIGVFAKGKHVQQATDFLAFFTNPDNAKKLAQYFPPPRESLLTPEVLGGANPLFSADQLKDAVISSIKSGEVLPSHQDFAKIDDATRAALDALWKPDADISGVLDSVCSTIQPMLTQSSA